MILYQNDKTLGLEDFGIQIPYRYHRPSQIIDYLKNSPHFRPEWDKEFVAVSEVSPLNAEQLQVAHDDDFIESILGQGAEEEIIKCYELRDSDGNWNRFHPKEAKYPLELLAELQRKEAAASLLAARKALKSGYCYHLGGGQHHAMSNAGRGFCLVNDTVILSRILQKEDSIRNIWVIDVDAHKGDGTAALTMDDPSISTLSIHMKSGWPLDDHAGKDIRAEIASDIDIPIGEDEQALYIEKLKQGLATLKDSGSFPKPDLAVVINGSDPSERDILPSTSLLTLSDDEMLERDLLVDDFLADIGVPQLWLLAGGYGDKVYEIHGRYLEERLVRNK